jgi:hypothetical protein
MIVALSVSPLCNQNATRVIRLKHMDMFFCTEKEKGIELNDTVA